MDNATVRLKQASWIAIAALGVQLLLTLFFFKERFFFADTSFIAFDIINNKSLAIMNHRYGSFITQLFPYLAVKMHLSLSAVLVAYAISFHVFFLISIALVYQCRQYGLAILMSLYYFLLVSDSFFLANDEIHQGIAWMFLFYATIIYMAQKKVNVLLILIPFIILVFITISSHFIAIIPTLFLWVYFILEKDNWPFTNKQTVLLSVILVAVILLKFKTTQGESYETNNLAGVIKVSIKDIIESFSTPVVKKFFYNCVINYWIAIIVFIAGLVSLIQTRKTLLAIWVALCCVGYIVLMGLTFGGYDENFVRSHIETEWLSISLIIGAPFVLSLLPRVKPYTASLLLVIIFATRIAYLFAVSKKYTERTREKEAIMSQMKKENITKLAIYRDDVHPRAFMLDWALPFESILESAMDGDKPPRTYFFINRDDTVNLQKIKNTTGFFDSYDIEPPQAPNPEYLSVDTTQPYKVMSWDELFR